MSAWRFCATGEERGESAGGAGGAAEIVRAQWARVGTLHAEALLSSGEAALVARAAGAGHGGTHIFERLATAACLSGLAWRDVHECGL